MSAPIHMQRGSLPPLPLEPWEQTKRTLHMYCQIVGKLRLAAHPKLNHWWHVTLYASPLGLTTGLLESAGGPFQIELDLHAHRALVTRWDGRVEAMPFGDGPTVAAFYRGLRERLAALDIDARIARPVPYDVAGETVPFADDEASRPYDPEAVQRFWLALVQIDGVMREFRSRFVGKASPPHLFWHHLDLAMARYNGDRAPVADSASQVEREAYSHEVISFGWWAGDAQVREPAFYSYTAPAPLGLTSRPLAGPGAYWVEDRGQAMLAYERVRTSDDPRAELLAFYESAYRAGAEAARWSPELNV